LRAVADRLAFLQPAGIEEIYAALAHQESPSRTWTADDVVRHLRSASSDARKLTTAAGIAAASAWRREVSERRTLLSDLRSEWRAELDPGIRLAMATIVLAADQRQFRFSEAQLMGLSRIGTARE
jgi:hypothetical protein